MLIVNPFATAVNEHRIALVERTLARHANVRTLLTQHPRHATELASASAGEVDAIFVFSGDGGFNEALNGLDGHATPIGCIPGGGTSVFPRTLGIPRDPIRAAERLGESLERGRTRTISVGRVNGRRFGFNAGIGLDAELVRRIEERRSRDGRPGDAAFVATLLKLLAERRGRFDPALELTGLGRASFLFVANANPYSFIRGFPLMMAPQAELEKGLDLMAPTKVRPHTVPRLARYVMTGRGQISDRRVITAHDLDRIQAFCDAPMPLQADGEDLGDVTEAVFEAERGAVSVLV